MLLRHATRQTARTFSSTAIPATSVATLHELGVAAGDVYGDQKSLGAKDASSGEWTWTSYAERNAAAPRRSALCVLTLFGAGGAPSRTERSMESEPNEARCAC